MSDVTFDITADGDVRVSGFPAGEAAQWELLSRGLAGYFRSQGLLGPEHAQQRLDAFHALLDQYGIDKTGIVSGIVQ